MLDQNQNNEKTIKRGYKNNKLHDTPISPIFRYLDIMTDSNLLFIISC